MITFIPRKYRLRCVQGRPHALHGAAIQRLGREGKGRGPEASFTARVFERLLGLGHVSIDTTNIYAEVDLETKVKMLAACQSFTPGIVPKTRWRDDPSPPRVRGLRRTLQHAGNRRAEAAGDHQG